MSCFGCLSGDFRVKDETPLIIDVEETIADAAWKLFLSSHGRCRRRVLKRKNYKIDVPMNYYSFEQLQTTYKPRKRTAGVGDAKCVKGLSNSLTSPEHTGLETIFNNDTDKEQTYNFHFEKVRTATVSVCYQKGYSIGAKANFSLGLPKVLSDGSAGLEVDMRVEVSKTTGETFEQSMTTSATSEITVAANSHYTASVVMEERNLTADFVMDIIMSMPAKRAPVYIKDKKTGEQVYVYYLNSLPDLFLEFPGVSKVKDEDGKVKPDEIQFRIEGKVDGMQMSSHRINLSGKKIAGKGEPRTPGAAEPQDNDAGARTSTSSVS